MLNDKNAYHFKSFLKKEDGFLVKEKKVYYAKIHLHKSEWVCCSISLYIYMQLKGNEWINDEGNV
jgi:hypothetical protein